MVYNISIFLFDTDTIAKKLGGCGQFLIPCCYFLCENIGHYYLCHTTINKTETVRIRHSFFYKFQNFQKILFLRPYFLSIVFRKILLINALEHMRAPPFKRKNIKNNLKMMNVVRKKCLKRILQVPLYAKRA